MAPFLIVATVSGGLYALAPTIEQIVYDDYLHVDTTGPTVPVSEQVSAAARARPDLVVSAVRPSAEPGDTTRVLFDDPALGESERLAVFVDPVTAETTGQLVMYGSAGALPIRTWISQLHRHLHLGEPGRIYSELAASWLSVITLGGVYLWVARYRTARRRPPSAARLWTLDRASAGRARTLNWHVVVGIWIAVGLVFLSATGLTWSKYAGENVADLRSALSWTTPVVDADLADASAGKADIDQIDAVLETARANGISGEVEATIPSDTSAAFTVEQTRQPWRFATDTIAVDGSSAAVTDISRFDDWPLAAKLTSWGIALHMGFLFGLVSQIALALLAAGLVSVIVRGYLLWWRRRPTRGSRLAGRAPARGAWKRIPRPATAAALAGTVAVGWFVPLLGVSLLAFLVIDFVVGIARTRN